MTLKKEKEKKPPRVVILHENLDVRANIKRFSHSVVQLARDEKVDNQVVQQHYSRREFAIMVDGLVWLQIILYFCVVVVQDPSFFVA